MMKKYFILYGGILGGLCSVLLLLIVRYMNVDSFVGGGWKVAYFLPFVAGIAGGLIVKNWNSGILPFVRSLKILYGIFVIGTFICLSGNFIIDSYDTGVVAAKGNAWQQSINGEKDAVKKAKDLETIQKYKTNHAGSLIPTFVMIFILTVVFGLMLSMIVARLIGKEPYKRPTL